MGSVGLNFGSPTSGAGFDVSATVSTIMSNLQGIEKPWKDQLTSLHSQDTVISSLGTLLSALSTDLSNLTNGTGILSQKTGSSSDNNALQLTAATNSAVAGSHSVTITNLAQTSSGYLDKITNASDKLSGSIELQVGATGTKQTITLPAEGGTLDDLKNAINSSGAGIIASVLTDSSGSRLSLVSGTSGASGGIQINSNSITDVTTANTALGYHIGVDAKDAKIIVDGVELTTSTNTVTNLIPGVTFQLLAPSALQSDATYEQIQVVIGNYNTGVESSVNAMVSDYNALISAMNEQEGLDSSGKAEPLFGNPTLSLLQQNILGAINFQNPNGYMDAISNNNGTNLSGSMTIQVGTGTAMKIVLGADPDPASPAANTFYAGSGVNTISGLADAINSSNIGVTAGVTILNGQSTLTLKSALAGANGSLTVASSILATSNSNVNYTGASYSSTTFPTGLLGALPDPADALIGSVTIKVGSGTAQTFTVSTDNTLAGLRDQINAANLGVTADVVTTDGVSSLSLLSDTMGSAGALMVSSNLLDTTSKTSKTMAYNNSSDIAGLTGLGISVNNDGTLNLDPAALDSILNSDYRGVQALFQNANSWGLAFKAALNNAGSTSSTGVLKLAQKSNSSIEATLNDAISRQESMISVQQKHLTLELNTANQIMQAIPSMMAQVNMLYSAITGYNQNK